MTKIVNLRLRQGSGAQGRRAHKRRGNPGHEPLLNMEESELALFNAHEAELAYMSVDEGSFSRRNAKKGNISPELISAFIRFVENTRPSFLHRCVHRMMHEYIVNDREPDDEYMRSMVVQMGELFQLLEEMQDSNKSGF